MPGHNGLKRDSFVLKHADVNLCIRKLANTSPKFLIKFKHNMTKQNLSTRYKKVKIL